MQVSDELKCGAQNGIITHPAGARRAAFSIQVRAGAEETPTSRAFKRSVFASACEHRETEKGRGEGPEGEGVTRWDLQTQPGALRDAEERCEVRQRCVNSSACRNRAQVNRTADVWARLGPLHSPKKRLQEMTPASSNLQFRAQEPLVRVGFQSKGQLE